MKSAAIPMVTVLMIGLLRTTAGLIPLPPTTTDTTTSPTTTPTTTTSCPETDCSFTGCRTVPRPDGCLTCDCSTYNCDNVTCGPDQECVMQDVVECYHPWCPPEPTCVSLLYDTTTDTTTHCPGVMCFTSCDFIVGSDGCVACDCRPICERVACGPGEKCVENDECVSCYFCVSIYGSTTETTTGVSTWTPTGPTTETTIEMTTTGCPTIPWCRCGLDDSSEGICPSCKPSCFNPICWFVTCPPGERCVPDRECSDIWCYSCVPIDGLPTTTPCTITTCAPHCAYETGPEGCPRCDCPPTCQDIVCAENEECVQEWVDWVTEPHFLSPKCVTKTTTETTTRNIFRCIIHPCTPYCNFSTVIVESEECRQLCGCQRTCENYTYCAEYEECTMQEHHCYLENCVYVPTCIPRNVTTTTTTTPNTTKCNPDIQILCREECQLSVDSDGCQSCYCPSTCEGVKCWEENVCEMQELQCLIAPCPTRPVCVPRTTTPPCPIFDCAPGCDPVARSDGCVTSCTCPPTCENFSCKRGYVCELQEVWCITDPCYPQPRCVAVQDSCKGTPNPRRCGRFKNRWTYNSVTGKCEKFRHYGCTPSLNTFLSPKACKNRCKRGAQSICEDVVCEKNCYTYTRKNKCPRCICPNPCRGFKCREGYECKMRESKCENKDPKPFCAKKS